MTIAVVGARVLVTMVLWASRFGASSAGAPYAGAACAGAPCASTQASAQGLVSSFVLSASFDPPPKEGLAPGTDGSTSGLGDARASLERELAALHAKSFAWAMACTGRDRDRATEALQEAYVRVLDGRARFERRATLKTWFFGVVRIVALEQRRWAWLRLARRQDDASLSELPADERLPDSSAAAAMRARTVAAALVHLSAKQREVLHLVFYEDMSIRDAAAVMGVALGTARLHYERGKARLATILAAAASSERPSPTATLSADEARAVTQQRNR